MEFEDLLQEVGGFGKFQKKLLALCMIPIYCIIPLFHMNKIFILSVPRHWCKVPELASSNLSIEEQRTLIGPPGDPSCSMYNINYTDMLSKGIFSVPNDTDWIPCKAGWNYDTQNYDETAASKYDLVCQYDYLPSLLFTLSGAGTLIGTTALGFLADKFGRKKIFLSAMSLLVLTELGTALINNFTIFIVLRILHGTCSVAIYQLPHILILELVAPNMRAHMNGAISFCYSIGLCMLPLLAYLSRDWTYLCYGTAASGLFILSLSRLIPESPRWLLSQDKYEEAKKLLIQIGQENGNSKNQPVMLLKLQAIKDVTQKKKESETVASQSRNVILRYPRLRRFFLVLTLCWVATFTTCSGLMYNIVNLNGNEFFNFFLFSVFEIPGNLIFWYAMDKVGRRWTTTFGFFLTGGVCFLPTTGFRNSDVLSSMLGKLLISGVILVVDQQSVELFPTVARTLCIGAGKTISHVVALVVPFIAYLILVILLKLAKRLCSLLFNESVYDKSLPFIVIGCTCFAASGLSSLLPESLNENLPQTGSDSEKFGKDQKFFSWNRKNSERAKDHWQNKESVVEMNPTNI